MIKEKFLQVLKWFRDNFRFLLEVVVRLSLGIENKQVNHTSDSIEDNESDKAD